MHPLVLLSWFVLFVQASCTVAPWRETPLPCSADALLGAEDAKVQFDDGNWLVLSDPRLEQVGSVRVLVGDVDGSSWHVPCSEVRRLATRRTEFWPVVANTVVVTACVAAVLAVSICAGQVPDVFSGIRFDFAAEDDDIGTSRPQDCAEKGRAEGARIP
ncbi:MAG: hypothetical protein ABL997_10365 [Planctomycetota bacterium]